MDRAKRRLVSAIDGIRAQFTDADSQEDPSSTNEPSTLLKNLVKESIEKEHCRLTRIVRHGFPDDPICMDYDPVQKLCAIGAGRGCVRLLGQAGVDHLLKHESDEPVMHIQFLINEGGLVTALRDDTLHLWNYRQRIPEIVHSLRMSKERVTAIHLPFQSKWLMVGTDKGNIYFLCLGTFELSNQIVYWNKAVDMTCRTHPGAIRVIESSPTEQSKLLIIFERGQIVLWNITTKEAEKFTAATELSPVTAVSWNSDGRQFMCGHQNGSLSVWNVKKPREWVHRSTPHSTTSPDQEDNSNGSSSSQQISCKPISQISWSTNAEGEQLIVFSGGIPADEGALPSLTVLRAKGSLTVLEMDHPIVSMLPLNSSPYVSIPQHPQAIAVLLKSDFLVVDMQAAQGYPSNVGTCIEVPHPMDLHESPVTLLKYYSDCPVEMIAALTLVGRNQRRQGVRLSGRPWPISGGHSRECATGHEEILLTGHEDGSIKFWQASSEQLQIMYKLKSGRHFEKTVSAHASHHNHGLADTNTDDKLHQMAPISHAISGIELCMDSRLLFVASRSAQLTLFRFAKTECCQEIAVITLPQLCRSTISIFSPSSPPSPCHKEREQTAQQPSQNNKDKIMQQSRSSTNAQQQHRAELKRQGAATDSQTSRNSSHSTDTTSVGSQLADLIPLKVRGGALRRPAGYQPELVCQIPWANGTNPERVTAFAHNTAYGLLAIGTEIGLGLIDIQTSSLIYAWSNSDLLSRESIPFWTSMASQSQDTAITSPTLEHQFSTQTPPMSHPPKSPGPLSRGNTADSAIQDNNGNRLSSFGPRVQQNRPQLIKAFTFNPTPTAGGEGPGAIQQQELAELAKIEQQLGIIPVQPASNGELGVESRTSSLESLEKNNPKKLQPQQQMGTFDEFICVLKFINCCAKKGSLKFQPCLWLGSSSGTSLALQLHLPSNRITSSVVVAPSGSIVRLAGCLLNFCFLDQNFCILDGPSGKFTSKNAFQKQQQEPASSSKDQAQEQSINQNKIAESIGEEESGVGGRIEDKDQKANKVLTKALQSPAISATENGPSAEESSEEDGFLQLALFIAESEVRVIALPSYRQFLHRQFLGQTPEEISLVYAQCTHIGGKPALTALNAAGSLVVFSLPLLRILMHSPLLGYSIDIDDRISNKFQISEHGLGIYLVSSSELQKFAVSAEIASQVADCMGELFVPCDMPEPPNRQQSFLRGVMSTLAAAAGAGTSTAGTISDQLVEMDTFLSEKPTSTAVSQVRTVAKPLITQQQQLMGIEHGTSRTITAGQAAREAMQNLSERGERLNAVTDATEQLKNNAMNIQNRSAKLLEKYEKKKWYQL